MPAPLLTAHGIRLGHRSAIVRPSFGHRFGVFAGPGSTRRSMISLDGPPDGGRHDRDRTGRGWNTSPLDAVLVHVNGLGFAHVELGMYPFPSVAWAWDDIWAAVHRRAPWTPHELTRSGDVHARWYDTDCLVTHVCGWPFAALHRNDMTLVGSFTLDIPEADDAGHYRSVLVSPRNVDLDHLIGPERRAVANSADSLSGWLSLLAATVGPDREWPGPVTFTSAHRDSLIALAKGDADLACIDSWTLALIGDEEPDLVADLHRVGLGPRIPTPALTARTTVGRERTEELIAAFAGAMADPATADARRALRIVGMSPNTIDDYLATLPLRTV